MKTIKKTKSQARILVSRVPVGIHETHVVTKSQVRKKAPDKSLTPIETGQPNAELEEIEPDASYVP